MWHILHTVTLMFPAVFRISFWLHKLQFNIRETCETWLAYPVCTGPTIRKGIKVDYSFMQRSYCKTIRETIFEKLHFMTCNVTQHSIKVQIAPSLSHLCCVCAIKKKHLCSFITHALYFSYADGNGVEIYRVLNGVIKYYISPKLYNMTKKNNCTVLIIFYFTYTNV